MFNVLAAVTATSLFLKKNNFKYREQINAFYFYLYFTQPNYFMETVLCLSSPTERDDFTEAIERHVHLLACSTAQPVDQALSKRA